MPINQISQIMKARADTRSHIAVLDRRIASWNIGMAVPIAEDPEHSEID